jgi:hypothetical protein
MKLGMNSFAYVPGLMILLCFTLWGTGVGHPVPMIRHSSYFMNEGCKHGDSWKF